MARTGSIRPSTLAADVEVAEQVRAEARKANVRVHELTTALLRYALTEGITIKPRDMEVTVGGGNSAPARKRRR